MKKLRRSLSLRSSQRRIPESCRPQVWENDSYKVRNGGVNFPVKYVGCIEVTESRGTQVCSEAFRRLKETSTAKKKRMTLLVTADCIRLVDDETKSLVVDQTIEKVSFCTPDPSNDRVFSYICREGTTRRWMCHCFLAIRDTGERLSHAVGCAFTACLQRKQKAQALQQQHQKQKEDEATSKTSAEPPSTPVVNGSNPATAQPQTQAQIAAQAISTATVEPTGVTATSSPTVITSPTVRASPNTVQSQSSQQPETVVSRMSNVTSQPVLKPPPATARPRPQAFNPSPFTRHMSLRYRSNPLSFTPLKEGGGYETLPEETISPVPRLPPVVDALSPETGSFSTSTTSSPGMFDPTPGPQRVPQPQPAPQQPQTFNSFGALKLTQVANPANQTVANSWQPFHVPLQPIAAAQGNAWSNRSTQLKTRNVSDAENWLATVQADTKSVSNGTGGNQGLLTTANPFSSASTQLDALSSAWTKDLASQLPNSSGNPVITTGSVAQSWPNQGDNISSLSSHHASSPQATNPFGQNKQVFWV